jgi:PKD repeat protein
VRAAEIWNPATGVWTTLASNAIRRTYHSTSLLLPDGRVLHAGSGEGAGMPAERTAELFSPPYLSNGSRPTIADAPTLVGYGTSFTVATPQAADIQSVSLIRLGSVTHAFDMNQRFQRLPFVRQSGALSVSAPASGTLAPPGHYLLFILNGNGVPSEAKIVKVSSASEPSPSPNAAPAAAFSSSCNDLACDFTDGSTDPDGNVTEWRWDFGDGSSAGVRHPSHEYAGEGTYTVSLTVTDAAAAEASTSSQVTVTPPGPNADPVADFTWSCPSLSCTFTDGSADSDGNITGWQWSFGDGTSAGVANPSHTYAGDGSYTVALTVTDNDGAQASMSQDVTVTHPPNAPPTADFSSSCTGLTCTFTDGSTDGDGSVTGWSWSFGDGGTSTARNPSRTYATAGTYTVTLTATDNETATGQRSAPVTVTAAPSISLTVKTKVDGTKQITILTWTGATSARVDIWRNGAMVNNTPNDGSQWISKVFAGPATYVLKVCEAGTTICSNVVTAVFN